MACDQNDKASDKGVEGPGDGQSVTGQKILEGTLDEEDQGDQSGKKSGYSIRKTEFRREYAQQKNAQQSSVSVGSDSQSQLHDSRPFPGRLELKEGEGECRSRDDHPPAHGYPSGNPKVLCRRVVFSPIGFIDIQSRRGGQGIDR